MDEFKHILSSLTIRNKEIKNRIFMSAHSYGYADEAGLPTDTYNYYVYERAKGGVGLIIMGATAVSDDGWHGKGYALNCNEKIIPKYRELSDEVHKYGTILFDQLFHAGGQLRYDYGKKVWAPSPIAHSRTCSLPVELNSDQIHSIVNNYADAAKRACNGELDGVEISAAQGFLVEQFISPRFNTRNDKYGGDFNSRMRFPTEVFENIRKSVNDDFVVGIRITADTFEDVDVDVKHSIMVINYLERLGLIDYVSVTAGQNSSLLGYWQGHGDMSVPLGTFVELSAVIRNNSNLPILISSRIKHPSQAETIISQGAADMAGMTRALIADPEIMIKVNEDKADDIRPCISCNQGCIGGNFRGDGVKCIINPATGREGKYGIGKLSEAKSGKKVLVVGGGVAGLEFAIVAAKRGHEVSLFEEKESLGGQLLLAKIPPNRGEFEDVISFYKQQMRKLGVEVHTKVKATVESISNSDCDVIVLATGAIDRIPNIKTDNSIGVTTGWKVLEGSVKRVKRVIIVDGDWKQHSLSIGEFLANKKIEVEIITSDFFVGKGLDITNIASFSSRLLLLGAKLTSLLEIVEIKKKSIYLRHVITNEIFRRKNIDLVVFVVGPLPNRELFKELNEKGIDFEIIGDCDYPRGIHNAILDAHEKAWKI